MDFESLALGDSGAVASLPGPAPSRNGHRLVAGAEQKSLVQADFAGPSSGQWTYLGSTVPGDVEVVSRETAYAAALYCYVAMRWRATNTAEPPLRVVAETPDGDEPIEDHVLSPLLADPSPDYDMGELMELTQLYADQDGRALWVKDPNLIRTTGRLTPFSGSNFVIEPAGGRILGRFGVDTARGREWKTPDEVVLFRYLDPRSRTGSVSPTDAALSWMGLGAQVKATVKNLLKNSMFPSVVIQADKEWSPSPEEYERWKAMLTQYHTGPANAGKPFGVTGGGNVTRISFTLRDLLPDELLDRIEACVAAAYGVPPVVLSFLVGLKNSPWSQMSEAKASAYEETVFPLWRRWEKALTRQLLRPVDSDPTHRIAFDTSAVRALQKDEAAKTNEASAATFWTLDERRVYSGQEPVGGTRGEWIEAVDGAGAGLGPSGTTSARAAGGKQAGRARSRPETKAEDDPRATKWQRFDLLAKAQEESWAEGALAQLKVDRRAALDLFDEIVGKADAGSPESKAPPEADPDKVEALVKALAAKLGMGEGWVERTTPLIKATARTALKDLASELGIAFSVLEPGLLEYTRREAAFLVKNIPATTRDRIAAELKAGLAEGESIPELRERIQDAWAFSRERAELIARTETTRVTNGAQHESMSGYQASDEEVVVEKAWLSARDNKVRDEHAELDKDGDEEGWIPVDEAFANGLQHPGEPQCRCTTIYRIRDAA
ncbi:MAG: hypothetical protein AMXMBFR53_30050 [Gemmatimonadota bacterium]